MAYDQRMRRFVSATLQSRTFKLLPYYLAAIFILWVGMSEVDKIYAALDACRPAIDAYKPLCKPTSDVFTAVQVVRYLVIASAVAFPCLFYFIHNRRAPAA